MPVNSSEHARIRSAWQQYQAATPLVRARILRRILRMDPPFSPAWTWYFFPDPEAVPHLHSRFERERLSGARGPLDVRAGWLAALRQDWLYASPESLLSALWEARFSSEIPTPTLQEALGPTTSLWFPGERVWRLNVPYEIPDRYGHPLPSRLLPARCLERFRRLWLLGGGWRLPLHREVWLRPLDLAWQEGWVEFYFALPEGQAPEPWVSHGLRCRLLTDWPGLGYDAYCLTEHGVLMPRLFLEPRVWDLAPLPGPMALPSTVSDTVAASPGACVVAGHTE